MEIVFGDGEAAWLVHDFATAMSSPFLKPFLFILTLLLHIVKVLEKQIRELLEETSRMQ